MVWRQTKWNKNALAKTIAALLARIVAKPWSPWALHVDVNPGDRANTCGGGMEPIRTEPDARKGYVIIHRCTKCGEIHRNRAAHEAKVQPDNIKLLIKLTAGIQ